MIASIMPHVLGLCFSAGEVLQDVGKREPHPFPMSPSRLFQAKWQQGLQQYDRSQNHLAAEEAQDETHSVLDLSFEST